MLDVIVWSLALGTLLRFTHLVTKDRLTAPIRAALILKYGPDSWQADFIRCHWCVSFWAALPIFAIAALATGLHVAFLVPAALTGSYVNGLVGDRIEVN